MQYQKNLWTESALTRFVTSMLNPLTRINSPEDLLDFMSSRDCVIVAFIDYEAHSRHYNSFLRTSLKFIEKDPFNEIGFGMVLGETSVEFGVDRVPTIRAYLWNETIEYNGNISWTSREISKWIHQSIQQVTLYLSPPGIKSSSLAPYMKQGPVLLLFTPRNLYLDFSDSYVMLRQIGMEYYNCKDDDWVHEVARDFLFTKRKENHNKVKQQQKECLQLMIKAQQMVNRNCKASTSTVSYQSVLNTSKNAEMPNYCDIDEPQNTVKRCDCIADACLSSGHEKYTMESNTVLNKFTTSMLNIKHDEKSPESVDKYNQKRNCEMLRLAEERSEILFVDDANTAPLERISGLACKSNRTFTLVSMDSVSFHTFAERLGVDILEIENKTSAIIIDQENESTYLLDEPVNLNSLVKFIYSYHRDGLQRYLRTNSIQYRHTHFFDINQFLVVKQNEKIERREMARSKRCSVDEMNRKDHHMVIREISSEEFDSAVIKSNKVRIFITFESHNTVKNGKC